METGRNDFSSRVLSPLCSPGASTIIGGGLRSVIASNLQRLLRTVPSLYSRCPLSSSGSWCWSCGVIVLSWVLSAVLQSVVLTPVLVAACAEICHHTRTSTRYSVTECGFPISVPAHTLGPLLSKANWTRMNWTGSSVQFSSFVCFVRPTSRRHFNNFLLFSLVQRACSRCFLQLTRYIN